MHIPKGLIKCEVCGDYKGQARLDDLDHQATPRERKERHVVSCRCAWAVCWRCRVETMRRPTTNYFEPTDGKIWHAPFFSGMHGCDKCREEIRQEALKPRPHQPWVITAPRKIRGVTFHDRSLEQASEAFVLQTMTEAGPLTNATFYLVANTVMAQPQTPEDKPLVEQVLTTPHLVEGRQVAPGDDPEVWFRALPGEYRASSTPGLRVVSMRTRTSVIPAQ